MTLRNSYINIKWKEIKFINGCNNEENIKHIRRRREALLEKTLNKIDEMMN